MAWCFSRRWEIIMSNVVIYIIIIGVILLAIVVVALSWFLMRRKFIVFTEKVCDQIDNIIDGKELDEAFLLEESLYSKITLRLKRLSVITHATVKENIHQKQEIQSLVSDISHQLKTPIANITMYCDTIINHHLLLSKQGLQDESVSLSHLSKEQEVEFLKVMQKQVEKLDFLTQSLVKMSRLENNIIVLKKEKSNLFDSIVEAVSEISFKAEKKNLKISAKCDENYMLSYDKKWTIEAIFNVLDNAVKYTKDNGTIDILVEYMEMFTKITVSDSGIGIAEEHINDIFKRFYREEKVHAIEGVGIGLYLTREIITKQGGYIKVESKEEEGTRFSLYLSN